MTKVCEQIQKTVKTLDQLKTPVDFLVVRSYSSDD